MFSILQYHFMQNAILAGLFGGITCSVVGVFVVTMHLSFIGVCIAHAAFAGALLGLWLGFNPLIGALLFSLASAAIIGPVADRGELNPDTSIDLPSGSSSSRGHTGDSHLLRLVVFHRGGYNCLAAKYRRFAYLLPYSQSRSRCLSTYL